MTKGGKREVEALETAHAQFNAWRIDGLDFPSFRVSLIAKVMDRLTNRELAALGKMPIAEWRVLSRLALTPGGLTVRGIAERAWVDRAEVSRAAKMLAGRGLISRRENPNDGRAPILFVTEEGMAAFEPVMAVRTRFHARVMQSIDEEEKEQLDCLLEKLAKNLLAMVEDADREEG